MREWPVHIVDDDPPFRESLRLLLDSKGYAVKDYDSARSFLDGLGIAPKGCALVDVHMPDMNGLALQEWLNEREVALPVIIMTGRADVAMAVRAMKAGAVDFIEKPFDPHTLLSAVEAAHLRADDGDAEIAAFRARLNDLTERQCQILEGVVAGLPTKVIAYQLGISPRTVDVHRARISEKLGITGLPNLVRLALAAGLSGGKRYRG